MSRSYFSGRLKAELLDACQNGRWSDVEHLLGNGATLNCWDVCSQNPLHHACLGHNYNVAENSLRMQGVDCRNLLSRKTVGDETPLHMACRLGHEDLVTLFISKGALTYSVFNEKLESPLHVACSYGHDAVVKRILLHVGRAIEVDARDMDETVPLFSAVEKGHIEIVKTLLANGADATIKDKFGNSALHLAILKEHWKIMEQMLLLCPQSVVDDPNKHGRTPLLLAVVTASEETPVKSLLTHNADPNIADCAGCTPLFKASVRGQLNMVKALLAAGAEVDRVDEFQRTPLTVASHKGHADLIQLLLEHGAKIHVDNARHLVLEAKEKGHEDVADLLTEHL